MASYPRFLCFMLCMVALYIGSQAQPVLRSGVLSSGGAVHVAADADSIHLGCTIGQSAISTPQLSASQRLFEGFWVPWQFEMTTVDLGIQTTGRLEVYPNPFSVRTTIRLPDLFVGAVDVTLFNLSGERVRSVIALASGSDRTEVQIDAFNDVGDGLPTGLYILEVSGTMRDGTRLRKHGIIHLIQ